MTLTDERLNELKQQTIEKDEVVFLGRRGIYWKDCFDCYPGWLKEAINKYVVFSHDCTPAIMLHSGIGKNEELKVGDTLVRRAENRIEIIKRKHENCSNFKKVLYSKN